ncbi:MAG: polyphosphate kinase 2 [Myxococcales bacterium]|nr:polyphosphate kinase 2 [Myxococcales bacterium]
MEPLTEHLEELDRPYLLELGALQVELTKMQRHIRRTGLRMALIFEGRDAAGKGGTISRLTQYLDPRYARTVALQKPNERESGQWYFQRYLQHLPTKGEIVCFDRSWYNRAVVEPALGFCSVDEHEAFLDAVVPLEHMLVRDGLILAKYWLSISPEEQEKRLADRERSPLRSWKLSPTDHLAHERFDLLTHYKEKMFARTSHASAPWVVVQGDEKKAARLAVLRHVLSLVDYEEKGEPDLDLTPDPRLCRVRLG